MDNGDTYDITTCYGVNCLDCSRACEFREAGLSVIAEKKETVARRFGTGNTVEYDDELLNNALLPNDTEIDDPDFEQGYREGALATVRKLVNFYIERPQQFEVFVHRFFLGGNQSRFAEEAGITRQAISKAIKEEKQAYWRNTARSLEDRLKVMVKLTPLEHQVYQLIFVDGVSIRSAAEQLKISRSKVERVRQILRSKLPKFETVPEPESEKIAKSLIPKNGFTPDLF